MDTIDKDERLEIGAALIVSLRAARGAIEFSEVATKRLADATALDSGVLGSYAMDKNLDELAVAIRNRHSSVETLRSSLVQYLGLLLTSCVLTVEDGYDSRWRVALRKFCEAFHEIDFSNDVGSLECALSLSSAAESENDEESIKQQKRSKWKRWAAIGGGAVVGGVVIGLTGGLAAPGVAAGLAAVSGALGTTAVTATFTGFLATGAGAAVAGALFASAGAGLTGYKIDRRTREITDFEFCASYPAEAVAKSLAVAICVGGFTKTGQKADELFRGVWRENESLSDVYTLLWERTEQAAVGAAIESLLSDAAMQYAATEALKRTVLSGLVMAVAWPASLLSAASVIDNPWGVLSSRTSEAGELLADVLIDRRQGKRPVTLVGVSLGCAVICNALKILHERSAYGIVENVVFFGAAVKVDEQLISAREVVAGRFVNVYLKNDWSLLFNLRMYSSKSVLGHTDSLQGFECVSAGGINSHYAYADDEYLSEMLNDLKVL